MWNSGFVQHYQFFVEHSKGFFDPNLSHFGVFIVDPDADKCRPILAAASMVVPEPKKESSTVSSTKLNNPIKRFASFSGYGAGWPFVVDARKRVHI